MVHGGDRTMGGQERGQPGCVGAVHRHPQRQRFQPEVCKPGIEGSQGGAAAKDERGDVADAFGASRHHAAHRNGMAAEILGDRMQHQIGAVFDRTEECGTHECGVHDRHHFAVSSQCAQGAQVRHTHRRVRHGFDEQGRGGRGARGTHGVEIGEFDERRRHTETSEVLFDHHPGAAVRVRVDDDVVTGSSRSQQRCTHHRHPRRGRHRFLGTFERGDGAVEFIAVVVPEAVVAVTGRVAGQDACRGVEVGMDTHGALVNHTSQRWSLPEGNRDASCGNGAERGLRHGPPRRRAPSAQLVGEVRS